MRRIVITGPQPVDMLDLVGPLEVFKFAPEYEVAVASSEGTTELQLNHGFKISYAVFCLKKKPLLHGGVLPMRTPTSSRWVRRSAGSWYTRYSPARSSSSSPYPPNMRPTPSSPLPP